MPSALSQLAAAVGIIPSYRDQTGKETRVASDETKVAILAAMGIDGSSEARAAEALRGMRDAERRELLAPVRVEEYEAESCRTVSPRLRASGGAGAWELEVTEEGGRVHRAEGKVAPGERPLCTIAHLLPIGYHALRLRIQRGRREHEAEQTLIVVPPRCTSPDELLHGDRAFGVVANLYALHSDRNWGIGDFTDLATLTGWAGSVGADFVGVNPLHALLNQGADVSPYSPVSRLFRNVAYLDVEAIPELRDAPHVAERLASPALQAELNVLREGRQVEYARSSELKGYVLEELYRVFRDRVLLGNEAPARAQAYREWVASQEPELTAFATWMAIAGSGKGEAGSGEGRGTRDEGRGRPGGTPDGERHAEAWMRDSRGVAARGVVDAGLSLGYDWHQWPRDLQDATSEAVRRFQRTHSDSIEFHRWLQFEADRQLGVAADGARRAGMRVGLYQDLAIGTSPNGSDAWAYRDLFVRGASIGAPPDPYSASGQNWGLPPIDARRLRADRYRYFINLVRNGFRHAGALRIDHVMGLFRLFWIPEGRSGTEGAYVRMPSRELLGIVALESVRHRALVVGEDLGTVPRDVPPALRKWGVLSSKVLYFERDQRGRFRTPETYAELALATANTHDMPTLAGFFSGHDIELRARVGLLKDERAVATAREERERDRRDLVERLREELGEEGSGKGEGWGRGTRDEYEGSGKREAGSGTQPEDGMRSADGVAARSAPDTARLTGAIHAYLCRTPSVLVGLSLDDLAGEEEPVNLPGVGPDRYPSWTRKMHVALEELPVSEYVRAALRCDRCRD